MSGGEYGAYGAYKGWNKEGHGSHLLVIFKKESTVGNDAGEELQKSVNQVEDASF